MVENSRTGKARSDIPGLRDTFCDGRVGERVIFYQLIVSRHWHYYWLCSSTKAKRAATRTGARKLASWLRRVKRRAQVESGDCERGATRRIFSQQHESGVQVKAYCDGVLILRYPDRGKTTISFRGGETYAPSGGNTTSGGASCPRCPTCTTSSGRTCPPREPCPVCPRCPAQRQCPRCAAPNTKETCKTYGEKAFWMGVGQACKRICTAIYKQCRKINPKTAMCYQLSEYCAGMKGVCKR